MQPPGDDSKYESVEAVAHPPQLGGSVAEPAIVRRDQEMETAVRHFGNLGGAPRALVEFRSGGAAVDVFGWRSRHRSCGPSAQFPRSGIAKFVVNVLPRYQQNGRLPQIFACVFNRREKNQELSQWRKLLLLFMFLAWCPWPGWKYHYESSVYVQVGRCFLSLITIGHSRYCPTAQKRILAWRGRCDRGGVTEGSKYDLLRD